MNTFRTSTALALALGSAALGCAGSIPQPRFDHTGNADRAAPLGPGYVLLPLGTEDDAMLGQIIGKPLEAGRALEEVAAPNPCAAKLGAHSSVGMVSTLEDAEELTASAQGRATLGVYGFSAQASRATHFVYKLSTQKKTSVDPNADYLACCANNACGYGVVTELVYGDGDYSAAEETTGAAGVDIVSIADAHGTASLKLLHKRHVQGWIAAKVFVHPHPSAASAPAEKAPSVLGPATVVLDVDSVPAQIKSIYDREHIALCPVDDSWAFCDAVNKYDEYDFAAKFDALVKTDQLADLQARRNWGAVIACDTLLIGGGALVIATAVVVLAGIKPDDGRSSQRISSSTATLAFTSLGVGGAALLTGAIWSGVNGISPYAHPTGSVTNHRLTREDGQRLADQYNRVLLRDITSDVANSTRTPPATSIVTVRPTIGMGTLGLSGTF